MNGPIMSQDTSLFRLLPDREMGLVIESEQIIETREDFYAYINGGAELYLHYGFKKLGKRTYLLNEDKQIKAEVFDMGAPKNAYGVFSYSKDTVNTSIGQQGQYLGGSLIFWQDRYYVSVFARRENQAVKETILKMGEGISESIGTKAPLPGVFHIMPDKDLVQGSTFYFHHHAWQNKYNFISHDNIFHLDQETTALLSRYRGTQSFYHLLLVEYPDAKAAKKAYKTSTRSLSGELKKQRLATDEHGRWMGCDRDGRLLVLVMDAPSPDQARYLLDKSLENYEKLP
jgi:hypothetical protein